MKKVMATIIVTLFLASIALNITPARAQYLVDPYTVGLWHLDGDAMDSSPNANDGTIFGATFVDGKFGRALSFDGFDDYINIPDDPSLDITGDITLEAWFQINSFSTSEGYHMYILSKDTTSQRSYGIGVDLVWQCPQKPFFIVFDGISYKVAWGTTTLATQTWYHIMGVFYASTGDLKLYLNGVLESSEPSTMTSIYSGTADLQIGAREYLGHRCFFNGIIDEVRISDVARGPVDIDPDTLNLKSKGGWITSYIEVPGWNLLFKDDFESYALGTTASPPWTIVGGGTWEVEDDAGNKVYSAEISSYFALAYAGDMAWTDFIYQTKVKKIPSLLSPPSERYPDIFFRYQDFNNFYYVQLRDSTGTWDPNKLGLYARKAGGWQTIKIVSATIDPNVWYTVKIAIFGTSIRVYLSGGTYSSETLMIDATDPVSPLTNGAIGVGAWQSHAHFDNVVVTSHVSEVDLSTVKLYVGTDWVIAEADSRYSFVTDMYSYIADVDGDGTLERMVKFDKASVQYYLGPYAGEEVSLTISGQYLDGAWFYLSYTVRVIRPGR